MTTARWTTTALLALVLGAGVVSPAAPASAAPPVTVDDEFSMYEGNSGRVPVLRNDSDPDGDDLSVCRVAPVPDDAEYSASAYRGRLYVHVDRGAPAEIAITYYACDRETLVPGTVTITVQRLKPVRVVKGARPGRVRVTNLNDRRITFYWGNFFIEQIDGIVRVDAGDTRVIRVHRTRIHWMATFGLRVDVDQGTLAGIELPDRRRTP